MEPQRVTLEFQTDADAMHGILEASDGTRLQFWGWLELMAVLERLTGNGGGDQQTDGSPRRQPNAKSEDGA